MKLSLKGRIALIMLTGAMLTVLGVLTTAYHSLVDDFEQLYSQRQYNATLRAAEQVERVLALRRHSLEMVTPQLTNGVHLHSTAELQARLQRQPMLRQLFPDGVLVFDANATAITETTLVPGRLGTNYADRPHFRILIRTRESVISSPIIGRTTGAPLISFLSPILSDDGDLLGMLGA
ncbi:hypothetical protein MBH78_07320 [Oceanimonas sp. NS1]|nr:hypothetical protein [Oceanimonas sp. NS1]